MKALLKELVYIHSLFSFMLYLVGNFIVIVVLEYKLKNPHLKHTVAGFFSIALSGAVAYIVPIYIFKNLSPFAMQTVGILAAFMTQALFWGFWFRKRFVELVPALVISFALTALVALGMYFIFMSYVDTVIKGTLGSLGPCTRYLITNF